jgi:serine/threonine protein phosphatase PrpC
VSVKVEAAGRSDIGLVRRSNQDHFGLDERWGLFLVCDGMGGAAGGEVASALAVETFLEIARQELTCANCGAGELTPRALRRAVAAANRAVIARATWVMRLRGMGSTLVGVRVVDDRATVVNVGDSRAYLVRSGVAHQLTQDHSYVAEQVRLGRMAEADLVQSPMRSVITRAIGADVDVMTDVYEVVLQAGDVLLLSSDGLTRHVAAEEIPALLAEAENVDAACAALIALAKARGGSDNVTCLAVKAGSRE